MQTDLAAPGHRASSPVLSSPDLVSATREDTKAIFTAIREFRQRVTQQSEQNTNDPLTKAMMSQPLETHESQEGPTSSDKGCNLMRMLEDLKDLIFKKGPLLPPEATWSIIETLDRVLDMFDDSTAHEHRKRKRSESPETVDTLPQHAIKRARGLLVNSHFVTVGRQGKITLIRLDGDD